MSDIRANTISDAAGTGPITLTKQSAAKAHIKYDSSGAIQGTSVNVSSVTDTATGRLIPSFTNSFNNNSYTVVSGVSDFLGASNVIVIGAQDYSYTVSVSQCAFSTVDGNGGNTYTDATYYNLAIHGDLA